ncbi:hypothetical protein DS2_16269 [Catenovulum agarivorans DS-2]|uniref:DNA alkylation repair protein n=1 Tax=Catenovulum agarivorans DS-2 TaxID=1328313 RepID=W7QTA4_9ALTE|nr:hypothetical protein [Catenovulum agarivorans]EWH08650.1 hypothetical protein DS2_16269 [Catenovulum agarivorans DS-2]
MEPFKNVFNVGLIEHIATQIELHDNKFNKSQFIELAGKDLEHLELKQRSQQIYQALQQNLPSDYRQACEVLLKTLAPVDESSEQIHFDNDAQGIRGWAIMPMADFVALNGLDDIEFALSILKQMTKRFSAEFAIRYLIEKNPELVIATLQTWLTDKNPHVRRLISEGTRPRLPWGIRLGCFIEKPQMTIALLEKLKDDDSEYVRRSVANHLNDISKDHEYLVVNITENWLVDADKNREKLLKHACRGLIKQGHQGALAAFGFTQPQVKVIDGQVSPTQIELGEQVEITIELISTASKPQNLILDYAVHHQKAAGKTSAKVFKWKQLELQPKQRLQLSKVHKVKAVTTRKYYSGEHKIDILLNGQLVETVSFDLLVA